MTDTDFQLIAAVRHVRHLERSTAFYTAAFDLHVRVNATDAALLADHDQIDRMALRERSNLTISSGHAQTLVWSTTSEEKLQLRCDELREAGHRVEVRRTTERLVISAVDPDGYPNLLVCGRVHSDIPPEVYAY